MASYKTAEEKKVINLDMHTIIWAYTFKTDKNGRIMDQQRPVRGITGHDSVIGNFFVPLTTDNKWYKSEVVPINELDYADTEAEAIEGYNTMIENAVDNCRQHMFKLEELKI